MSIMSFSNGAHAQQRTAPLVSPEVTPDGQATFRYRNPAAKEVFVWLEGDHSTHTMVKDEATGIWSLSFGPLAPDLYSYSFHVDGLNVPDPANKHYKVSRIIDASLLDVPGVKPTPCEPVAGVARGTVHLHDYTSKSLGERRVRIYTPAAYDKDQKSRFPVLYLLHGSGDNEATWTEWGRANVMLDNMIAAGTAKPMIVVMTDGHASAPGERQGNESNVSAFEHDLLDNVMPLVESHYRTRADRDHRAIAGLSMGGEQSLIIGLNHLERFSYIGGMSSAVRTPALFDPFLNRRAQDSKQYPVHLLWLTIGRDDFLIAQNRAFDALLTAKGVPHDYIETEGTHTWMVWRRAFTMLAPRLFTN